MSSGFQKYKIFLAVSTVFFLLPFSSCFAAAPSDSFALTITPPLFQVSVSPGETWSSAIKVINNNSYGVQVYSTAMNFEPKGEGGTGRFIPVTGNATTSYSMASWIIVSEIPTYIPAEQTVAIPFTLLVPTDAEPGGHYGAILIGNQPSAPKTGNTVSVSAAISSLLLVKVNGNMIEKGDIREFSLDRDMYQEPKVKFSLRFENKGNIHLLPRGEIAIYNMWGKERGKIAVNQESDFGNVLPKSIRNFSFEWMGEDNFYEVGRYTAIATLAFGDQKKETVYREVSFWVIPFGPAFKIFAFLFVFIGLLVWSLKKYIRKALALEAQRAGFTHSDIIESSAYLERPKKETVLPPQEHKSKVVSVSELKVETLVLPITHGVVDLRSVLSNTSSASEVGELTEEHDEGLTYFQFIKKYKLFFACVIFILTGIYGVLSYFEEVLTYRRNFDVKVQREDGGVLNNTKSSSVKEGDVILNNSTE